MHTTPLERPEREVHHGFLLDGLRVDPATGIIEGPGGREQVDARVMAVLEVLARQAGELVSRSDLLAEIWPGGEVYDDSLTQSVYRLRQHLVAAGGDARFRELITTLPKRGYLLNAPVEIQESAQTADAVAPGIGPWHQGRRWLTALAAAACLTAATAWYLQDRNPASESSSPPDFTLAVLPFQNTGVDPADDPFSRGVSDALRDRMSGLPGWRVAARRSSAQFVEPVGDVREIGRLLDVSHIVEGRFTRERDRVLLSAELVDTRTGYLLWSQSYEQATANLLLAEQALAEDLTAQLLPGAGLSVLPPPTARQVSTHDLMLLARQYGQQATDEEVVDGAGLERSIQLYAQVLESDPDAAEAHAQLAKMLMVQGDVVAAEPHVLRALELDPERADTFTTLGLYYWTQREDGIGAAWQRALELNPNDPDALSYYASWSWSQGLARQAEDYYRRALVVDPLSLVRYADLGFKLAIAGRNEEAGQLVEHMTTLFPTAPGYLAASQVTGTLGDLDVAIAWALKAERLRPGDADIRGQLAEVFARLGEFDLAARFEPEPGIGQLYYQARWADLVELGEDLLIDQPGDLFIQLTLAFAYGALGETSQSLRVYAAAGMPDIALSESRRAQDIIGIYGYACTLATLGRHEEARNVLDAVRPWGDPLNAEDGLGGWIPRLREATQWLALGERERGIEVLETLPGLPTLTRLQWLRDENCFHGLREEPRYRAVVRALEDRTAALRGRLPATLQQFGVDWSR